MLQYSTTHRTNCMTDIVTQAGSTSFILLYTGTAPALTQLAWNEALSFERKSALVDSLGTQFGLTPAALDALFVSAAQITV